MKLISLLKNAGITLPLLATSLLAFAQNSSYNANTIPITGSYSTAFGSGALRVSTGSGNTATGFNTLYNNSSGGSNTATGRSTLYSNTSGGSNTASGYAAMYYNTTGGGNTGTGYFSLYANSTGALNASYGYQALYNNSTGNYNTATGSQALYNNTTTGNTADGYQALYSNTTGLYSVASGYQALYSSNTGGYNAAVGFQALYNNTIGSYNVAVGQHSLYTSYGSDNTAVGSSALNRNTSGGVNTAVGKDALYSNTSANFNSAVGESALYDNTIGSSNAAVGNAALANNTTGNNNTASGFRALASNITGSNNSAMGWNADVSSAALSNATAIGYNAVVDASNKVRIGNTSVMSIGGQVGWTIYSDKRVKKNIKEGVPGIAFIGLLKPVMYNYDLAKENELLGKKVDSTEWTSKNDIEKILFSGLVAQDVDAAAQKIGYNFSGIDKTGNIMGLRYGDFIIPMIKAIQEQQQQIEDLRQQMASKSSIATEHFELENNNASSLEQNVPNPFTKQTSISYSIPANTANARLVFYDAAGRLMGNYSITARGRGVLNLGTESLVSGTYSYTLIVDGKNIETKKLIKQ